MRILFLDIDGVLNSTQYMKNITPNTIYGSNGVDMSQQIDPQAVKLLDAIIHATGAKIVVSSTWRRMFDVDQIAEFLSQRGSKIAHKAIIDRTPISKSSRIRGGEIKEWLDMHSESVQIDTSSESIESYAIVDDDADMLPEQMDNFVNTDNDVGLTAEKMHEIISILNF